MVGTVKEKSKYAIDAVGTGVGNDSHALLTGKSLERNNISAEALLSARGEHHRGADYFNQQIKECSAIIRQANPEEEFGQTPGGRPLANYYYDRAYAYERLNVLNLALADYTEALKLGPTAQGYFNRSIIYDVLGDPASGVDDLKKAIRLEPLNKMFYQNRAVLNRKIGKYNEAANDIVHLQKLEAIEQGREEDAEKELRKKQKAMSIDRSDESVQSGSTGHTGNAPGD